MFDAEINMFDHDSPAQVTVHDSSLPPRHSASLAAALYDENELFENGLDILGGLAEYLSNSPVTNGKPKETVKRTPKKAEDAATRYVINQLMNGASEYYGAHISLHLLAEVRQ